MTQLLTLLAVSVLLSVSTPGVPHSWLVVLAPMLAAVGVPPEGVGLLMAVDLIPDMIYTTLNAMGYLAAAAIVSAKSPEVEEIQARSEPSTSSHFVRVIF
jgi:DAACS family dicarboxylate/amino acid:cation (Na+ or H+) symporter